MKILSQNKDCIYASDLATITSFKNTKENRYEIHGSAPRSCLLGVYSSKEKADTVIYMLFNCKTGRFIMPQNDKVGECSLEDMTKRIQKEPKFITLFDMAKDWSENDVQLFADICRWFEN